MRLRERAFENHVRKNRDLATAICIASGGFDGVPELHARILAKQGPQTIGAVMGLSPEVVTWYSDLFLDVRERLHATYWILFSVIGMDPAEPSSPVQLFLKHAYLRGPEVIPAWIDYLANPDGPHDLATELGRQRESIALLVDAEGLTQPEKESLKHLRLGQILREIEPEVFRNQSASAEFAGTFGQMLAEIPFTPPSTSIGPTDANTVSAKMGNTGGLAKPAIAARGYEPDVNAVRDAVYATHFRSYGPPTLVAQ
jgi:hypothetical protein